MCPIPHKPVLSCFRALFIYIYWVVLLGIRYHKKYHWTIDDPAKLKGAAPKTSCKIFSLFVLFIYIYKYGRNYSMQMGLLSLVNILP